MSIDVRSHNRDAWNRAVRSGNRWTIPVDAATITNARAGDWSIVLTPAKAVPRAWFGTLAGADVLGLASGGGQQMPVLAAAGARVTSFDNSPSQLERDLEVAAREGLELRTVEGDMRDLSVFADASFDLIFHPCSNLFVPSLEAVWAECYRVLKPGGSVLSGFVQPFAFCLDEELERLGELRLVHPAPYSDLTCRSPESLARLMEDGEPIAFGHTLEAQIGGQIAAGLVVTGYFDDTWGDTEAIDRICPAFAATRGTKPRS